MPTGPRFPGSDDLDALVAVLSPIRTGAARTRPELARHTGLGRTVVTQRVQRLLDAGVVEEAGLGPSTGGRQPRELRLRADAGHVLVADVGATSIAVGLTDLSGRILDRHEEPAEVSDGPEAVLSRIETLLDALLTARATAATVAGVGVGLPGPVEFATGRPIAPPIMPGWDEYPVRPRLAARYGAPVWVDNDVNLMALGELRAGPAHGERDLVFVKIGTGIGAGLVSGGALHRGAQGCAGDVGHVAVTDAPEVVCRCGNVGCLEALAGGAAIGRRGHAAALEGRSPFLAGVLEAGEPVDARAVARAAAHGDAAALELLVEAGRLVGRTLATIVNLLNPSLVVVGGGVAGSGDALLAAIRQVVYSRSLPLATRHLRVVRSELGDSAALLGAAHMVVDELFSRERLGSWIDGGLPAIRPELADLA